jgi:hypothetical protein
MGMVTTIRRIQQTNRRIAVAFLSLIQRTFRRIGSNGGDEPGIYGSDGSLTTRISPLLIEHRG